MQVRHRLNREFTLLLSSSPGSLFAILITVDQCAACQGLSQMCEVDCLNALASLAKCCYQETSLLCLDGVCAVSCGSGGIDRTHVQVDDHLRERN